MEKVRVKVLLEGRVQGVQILHYAQDEATRLGITGFARYLSDGRVEAVFQGDPEGVEAMLKWCETGSPSARVDAIALRYEDPDERFSGFEIRR
jgi:acylphosphatase